MSADLIARYAELAAAGRIQLRQADYEQAAVSFAEARRIAEQLQDQQLLFKATCNLSTARLNMDQVEACEEGLREILLRSDDAQVIFIASTNLASALRRQGRLEKALFYAKRALRACDTIDDCGWKASCHNLIGNIYMNMSYMDDALAEYRFALALCEKGDPSGYYPMDWIKDNLGYCLLLKKRHKQGLAVILEALQMTLQNGNTRCLGECYQDLSFAYLQLKQLKLAQEYGEKALALATEKGYKDILKNCYYLLGEIHLLLGEDAQSDRYFSRLQELYPHLGVLKEFLRTFDVSNILNLKSPF
jgi:tetratricopeptide (TPR) repeat protein